MGQYLIDNNVISKYFSSILPEDSMNFMSDVIDDTPNISVITQIEALSWVSNDKLKEKLLQDFIKEANVLNLTAAIVARCIAIRRNRKKKKPDAIIAATAIEHNLTLLTSDNGFANIPDLLTIDPLHYK